MELPDKLHGDAKAASMEDIGHGSEGFQSSSPKVFQNVTVWFKHGFRVVVAWWPFT